MRGVSLPDRRPFVARLLRDARCLRNEGAQAGRIDKGFITYDRKTKKDAFFLYKANWSSSAVLYITSRRFTNRTDVTTDVKVYTNCSSVTLQVNGNTIGTATPNNIKVAKWAGVTLQPGANTISVTGTRNGATYTDTVTWNLSVPRTAIAAAPAMFFSKTFIGPTKVTDDSLVTVVG